MDDEGPPNGDGEAVDAAAVDARPNAIVIANDEAPDEVALHAEDEAILSEILRAARWPKEELPMSVELHVEEKTKPGGSLRALCLDILQRHGTSLLGLLN